MSIYRNCRSRQGCLTKLERIVLGYLNPFMMGVIVVLAVEAVLVTLSTCLCLSIDTEVMLDCIWSTSCVRGLDICSWLPEVRCPTHLPEHQKSLDKNLAHMEMQAPSLEADLPMCWAYWPIPNVNIIYDKRQLVPLILLDAKMYRKVLKKTKKGLLYTILRHGCSI